MPQKVKVWLKVIACNDLLRSKSLQAMHRTCEQTQFGVDSARSVSTSSATKSGELLSFPNAQRAITTRAHIRFEVAILADTVQYYHERCRKAEKVAVSAFPKTTTMQ